MHSIPVLTGMGLEVLWYVVEGQEILDFQDLVAPVKVYKIAMVMVLNDTADFKPIFSHGRCTYHPPQSLCTFNSMIWYII
jgi:hypothetical protein